MIDRKKTEKARDNLHVIWFSKGTFVLWFFCSHRFVFVFSLSIFSMQLQQRAAADTRQQLERLFPAVPVANVPAAEWIQHSLSKHIEEEQQAQQKRQAEAIAAALAGAAAAAAVTNASSVASNNVDAKSSNAINNTTTSNNINAKSTAAKATIAPTIDNHFNYVNSDDAASSTTTTPATSESGDGSGGDADALILENAKLQATVEQYKTIVTETVSSQIQQNPGFRSF